MESEFSQYWEDSIRRELDNLEDHEIWEWVDLPKGRRCIDTTWRFKVKPTMAGLIDKFKSRLCARGCKQIFGLDFTETHAPVTVMSAWRANVAEMAEHKWHFDIFDVSGAYLNSDLIEEIYCTPPEGLEIPEGCENKVLRLKKALYGLKQAGRAWNKKFVGWLEKRGFKVSDVDPSLFIRHISEPLSARGERIHVGSCQVRKVCLPFRCGLVVSPAVCPH